MNKYIRQEKLKEINPGGQKKIRQAKIAIIGLGALGTTTAELLTRAGIGELLIIDKDKITIENLHRQTLYKEKHIGENKTTITKKELQEINKDTKIKTITQYLTKENTHNLDEYEIILDCTDNMQTRQIINQYCKETKKIWIHAAATGTKGNVLVVENPEEYNKIIRTGETFNDCTEIGVINTLTTMISAIQVTQTIKLITTNKYEQGLIRINLWESQYNIYKIKK